MNIPHMSQYSVGSNQYRKTPKRQGLKSKTWASVIIVLLIILILEVPLFTMAGVNRSLSKLDKAVTVNVFAYEQPETIEPETNLQREIVDYVYEVFGDDAPKAFAVLKCENASLNPKAVNTAGNIPAGSRDIGVFQINEYWQGVQGKFLMNWKINVQIAHQIYTDNGNSFERWSCGRRLGV